MIEGKTSCGFGTVEVASLVANLGGAAVAADKSNRPDLLLGKHHGGSGC
jgi:hypothetical protein